ncbi:unnamed protein product, partial [Mesorhabditis spiculigera]
MNGIYNMIPFMSQMIAKLFVVSLANWLKAREITGADASVKIFQGLGSLGCGVTIFLLAVVPSCEHPTWAIPILICHGISFSCSIPGFFTALVSIAPPYTGTMTSLGRTCATLGNISGAMMMSLIDKMNWPNKCSRVVLGLGDGFIIPCINTVITRLAFSCIIPGFFTSLLLIAPPYTGTMTSVGRSFSMVANISGAMLMSLIDKMGWKNKWLIIFSLDAFSQLTSGVFFIFYGKATIQEWAIPATTTIPTLNTPATSEAAIDLN